MPSIRKTIIFAFAAALAVVVVVYFKHRPKSPAPRQTVNSLDEIGVLPPLYDGWLAHVQAEIVDAEDAPPFGDGGCYFLTVLPIRLVPGKSGVLLNGKEIGTGELIDLIRNGPDPHSPILIRTSASTSLAEIESVAKALINAGFGDHVHPVLNGPRVDNVFSVKLGGRFLRVVTNSFQKVASLREVGALPKNYDGWLAHVEAELLAAGEDRPEDPLYPPGGPIRTPFIVDVSANGSIFLNNTARTLPELIAVTKLSFEGQTEPDPIAFRAADDARFNVVNAVALALVEAGFGDQLRPVLDGEKFVRVYSIKLGGQFMRVKVVESEPR